MDSKRTRNLSVELYPDNPKHAKALEIIQNGEIGYIKRFVGILHDCDTYEETTPEHNAGDTKKPHFHLFVELKDARTRVQFANKLDIESRFIEPLDKPKGFKMYLIHYNTDKYQYHVERLFGDRDIIQYICETANKDNKYLQFNCILEYIKKSGFVDFVELGQTCYINGWYTALKQNQNFIINAVNQHNKSLH